MAARIELERRERFLNGPLKVSSTFDCHARAILGSLVVASCSEELPHQLLLPLAVHNLWKALVNLLRGDSHWEIVR